MKLREYLLKTVDPKAYYSTVFEDVRWKDAGEVDVFCPFHDDERPGGTPSMSLNPKTGSFYCHSCGSGGRTIISFHVQYYDVTSRRAMREIYHRMVRPIIPTRVLSRYQDQLFETPTALHYVTHERHVSVKLVKSMKLGFDGQRFVFPIFNEFGMLINIKFYDPLSKKHRQPKMFNYRKEAEPRSYGSPPSLFPLDVLVSTKGLIVVTEGEWDALVLNSLGIPAVTGTAGSKSWPSQYNRLFAGRDVILLHDNDEAGNAGAARVAAELMRDAASIKRVKVPKKFGKDVTDWYNKSRRMRSKTAWLQRFKVSPEASTVQKIVQTSSTVDVSLQQASAAELFGKRIRVSALVTGKDVAPYMLPRRVRVTCSRQEPCTGCPLALSGETSVEINIDPKSPDVLKMVDSPEGTIQRTVLAMGGIPPDKCSAQVDVLETFNLEQLVMIPTLDSTDGTYVLRTGYFIGHGTIANRGYAFEGVTLPSPKDQHVTHLFDRKVPIQDEIETFEMTPELKESLKRFAPRRLNLFAHMMGIAEWQSRNITKIRERPDMHIAVDLAFHSVPSFEFNGEMVDRGMLDVLIIGDTRCGKGYVTERLSRYYRLGDIASGENCSFAGLVGGLQQLGKRWLVTWGIIPINNKRLVIIDEVSSMGEAEIGHMSRVRSEGVAEITKVVREKTQANTRLIWLSNCRSGRPLMSYNTGVEAIKELIGANEDISRFDLAMTVATNEVPSEIINARDHDSDDDIDRYPPNLARSLVLWAWSRQPHHVIFTAAATSEIIEASIELGHKYSPMIPLVQAENVRIKLAKLSAAAAARTFSTDGTCERVIVKRSHVQFIVKYLNFLYTKRSMAYDVFSKTVIASAKLGSVGKIRKTLEALGPDMLDIVTGMLEMHSVTANSLGDYTGDVMSAKLLISDLVRLRCLTREDNGFGYAKNPSFTSLLRKVKVELEGGR